MRRATALGDRQHVEGAHARGHQRLMRVAKSRVGDQQPLLFQRPLRKFLRPEFQQQVAACPGGATVLMIVSADSGIGGRAFRAVAFRLRIAIDDHVAEKGEQLGRAIAARL